MAALPSAALSDAPVREDVESLAVALQDPTRRRLLLALFDDGGPHTVDEVAGLVAVHRTVAFTHLERLTALGYVVKTRRRGQRGKPAALYQARTDSLELSFPSRQFQLLAGLLGTALASLGPRGLRAAREHGRATGRRLGSTGAATLDEALASLAHLGATYAVDGGIIATRHCVFREACNEARAVVCTLHAGVIEGALEAAAVRMSVTPRRPAAASGCTFSITEAVGT